jgi:hypothetical protein
MTPGEPDIRLAAAWSAAEATLSLRLTSRAYSA